MATINATQKIRADLYDNSEIVVRAKQYDKGTRYLNITCANNGSIVRIDPAEYEAYAKISTPNYCAVHEKETINSDGTVTVALTDNILHTAGTGTIDVNLYTKNSETLLSTMSIKLIISPSAYDDEVETNSNEFSALTDLIAEVTFKKNSYDKAESSRVDAEKKRVTAETNRVSAETTRASNENTRKTNETTRQSNETARKNAESARVTAENNRVTEFNTLKTNAETATAAANKVNIKSNRDTDVYSLTITNRNGQSSTSPNLLNKIGIGTVTTLASDKSATASLTGDFGAQKLNLGIPVGKTPNLKIGTVTTGDSSSATITGTAENPVLNLTLQKGNVLAASDYMTTTEFEELFQ